ncbi:MAG: hypothetical protein ACM3ZF_03360 [Mycobacterium leprae]
MCVIRNNELMSSSSSSVSVCNECSGLVVLDARGAREPTAQERASAERDPGIQRAIKEADECREWRAAWDSGPEVRDPVFARAALLVAPYLAERPSLDHLPLCPWCGTRQPAHV